MLAQLAHADEARDWEQKFNAAMAACQAELEPVARNQQHTSTNSRYADLAKLAESALPIVHRHGFALVTKGRLRTLYSFREIRRWFPATDDRNPFCIFAIADGASVPKFAFSLDAIAEIKQPERRFTLTPGDIASVNPNTRTAPIYRSKADAELTRQIYARVPVLIDEGKGNAGNPWGIRFQAMFHMSNDSGLFRTATQLARDGLVRDGRDWVQADGSGRYVPLYEAKMVHHYDHRWAAYEDDGEDTRDITDAEKADPDFEVEPRYWVPAREVCLRLSPLPKAFVDAMREGNEELVGLWLAQALLGLWLKREGFVYQPKARHGLDGEWRDFVTRHPAFRQIDPRCWRTCA